MLYSQERIVRNIILIYNYSIVLTYKCVRGYVHAIIEITRISINYIVISNHTWYLVLGIKNICIYIRMYQLVYY